MASAPARIAASTPSASVTPQILTKGRRATFAGSSGARPALTNEATAATGSAERMSASPTSAASNPRARQRATTDGSRTPDSAMTSRSSGTSARSRSARRRVDLEGPQVPVVQPDQPRVRGERGAQLLLVVRLHERLEPDGQRPLDEPREPLRRVEDREQQHEVGAGGAEHRQLDVLDDELLGEDRDRHGSPDGAAGRRANHRTSAARTGRRSRLHRRPRRRVRVRRCPRSAVRSVPRTARRA